MTTRVPALPGKQAPASRWLVVGSACHRSKEQQFLKPRSHKLDLHVKAASKEELEINVEINNMIFCVCGFKNDSFIYCFSLSVVMVYTTNNHKEILPQSTTN